MTNRTALAALPLLLAQAGCVTDKAARAEVAELRRQMDAMRRQTAKDHRTIDELENRVFVLEDQLDTAEVALERTPQTPRLPVVKKSADDAGDADAAEKDAAAADPYDGALEGEDVIVVYEGEAAKGDTRARITIHESEGGGDYDGGGGGGGSGRKKTPVAYDDNKSYPDPGEVTDRIPVTGGTPKTAGATDPIDVYKTAFAALKQREHQAAIAGFKLFLDKWPEHDYADNAQYWLGEAYYDQRDYKTALLEFRKVVKRYASGNKAPDALLKIGYCYARLGDVDNARDVLSQVVEIYPKTEAAKLAAKSLDEMRR